jgi:excisionase family DNA binding protein
VSLEEQVLTVAEAAKLLRVSPSTYYAAAKRGELPAIRIGRRLVVPGAALARLLANPKTDFPLEDSKTSTYLFHAVERG